MKKLLLVFGLLLIPTLTGVGVYWYRSQSLSRRLAEAQSAVGSRQGGELLERLARAHPQNAEVLFLHARQLRLEGQNDRALAQLEAAAERGWPQPQVARELLLLHAGTDFHRAEPDLQALLDIHPDDREALLALALGWCRQRNFDRAETLINGVLDQDPEDGVALCIRGRIRLQQQQPHDARPDLERALQLGSDRYFGRDARLLLAHCLLETGQFADARRRFEECRDEEPENPQVYFGLGRCAWYLGRWDEAANAFRQVLQLRPDHVDALSQLAYIHEERGELAQALRLLEQAARHDPKWSDLHFRMAKILLALGQKEQAAGHQKIAEEVTKRWAKPRSGQAPGRDPYTGEEQRPSRTALDH